MNRLHHQQPFCFWRLQICSKPPELKQMGKSKSSKIPTPMGIEYCGFPDLRHNENASTLFAGSLQGEGTDNKKKNWDWRHVMKHRAK